MNEGSVENEGKEYREQFGTSSGFDGAGTGFEKVDSNFEVSSMDKMITKSIA